jgi:hypothetical protein
MPDAHPIRCRCGAFKARVAHPARGIRAICYCRDCRTYAHYLGPPRGMLDAVGGTEAIIVSPASVSIVDGVEHLACMSLSPRGTLRWFTACCRTPIANTPRNRRIPHLALVHNCLELETPSVTESFGAVKMKVNRQSAHGDPGGISAVRFGLAAVRYGITMAWNRASGRYRRNPFFDAATGAPRAAPQVISKVERDALMTRV